MLWEVFLRYHSPSDIVPGAVMFAQTVTAVVDELSHPTPTHRASLDDAMARIMRFANTHDVSLSFKPLNNDELVFF